MFLIEVNVERTVVCLNWSKAGMLVEKTALASMKYCLAPND